MHVLTSPVTTDSFRLRTATAADADTIVELISLVDLHKPIDEVPAALTPMRHALHDSDGGPLSHLRNHFLIAEDADGSALGAITCGPAKWIAEAPWFLQPKLVRRLATVHGLAVRPEYRRSGIAHALVRRAEETFRDAGYAALMLRHDRNLTPFYQHLGYTSSNRVVVLLPTGQRLTLVDRGWKHAFKILSPSVTTTSAQGLPTIVGALSD